MGLSTTMLTIGGGNRNVKLANTKQKPVVIKGGDPSEKQSIVSIRPGKPSSSGITIKALNSGGPVNDHIMSIGG